MVDGHSVGDLLKAFSEARNVNKKPVALICKTFKGYNFPEIQDKDNWHGKPLGAEADAVIKFLETKMNVGPAGDCCITTPPISPPIDDCQPLKLIGSIKLPSPPHYKIGDQVSVPLICHLDDYTMIEHDICLTSSVGFNNEL